MFLSYTDFLYESTNSSSLEVARDLTKDKELAEFLNDAEEGKFPWLQIVVTSGAFSYVGVAINDGSSVSEVYSTSDPKLALAAIAVRNTHREDAKEILSILSQPDDFLSYSVFAGDRPMTRKEAADRFNMSYQVAPGDAVPFYTSTPISKRF